MLLGFSRLILPGKGLSSSLKHFSDLPKFWGCAAIFDVLPGSELFFARVFLVIFHFFPRVRMVVISASGVPCAGGCAQIDCVSIASQPSGMTYMPIPIRAFR